MDILDSLKIYKNIKEDDETKDELFELIIQETKDEVINYCNLDTYNKGLDFIIFKICKIKLNKLGAEGLNSHSYSSISESFISDYPKDIYSSLNKYRRLNKS